MLVLGVPGWNRPALRPVLSEEKFARLEARLVELQKKWSSPLDAAWTRLGECIGAANVSDGAFGGERSKYPNPSDAHMAEAAGHYMEASRALKEAEDRRCCFH